MVFQSYYSFLSNKLIHIATSLVFDSHMIKGWAVLMTVFVMPQVLLSVTAICSYVLWYVIYFLWPAFDVMFFQLL